MDHLDDNEDEDAEKDAELHNEQDEGAWYDADCLDEFLDDEYAEPEQEEKEKNEGKERAEEQADEGKEGSDDFSGCLEDSSGASQGGSPVHADYPREIR